MLFNYRKRHIIILSLIISGVICIAINRLVIFYKERAVISNKQIYSTSLQVKDLTEDATNIKKTTEEWSLKIPKIHLEANIEDGTSKEILNNYIGHFLKTSKWNGNIGLAAHNRGYEKNYFGNIKQLNNGDEIFYTYNGETKKYEVTKKDCIKNTDWSYLERTRENKITLITCIDNEPEYRLCVQAEEI